jgi:hypothetical protein
MNEQIQPTPGEHSRSQSKVEPQETTRLTNVAFAENEVAEMTPQEEMLLQGKGSDLSTAEGKVGLNLAHTDPGIKSLNIPSRNPLPHVIDIQSLQNSATLSRYSGSKECSTTNNDISESSLIWTTVKGDASVAPSSQCQSEPLLACRMGYYLTGAAAAGIAAMLGAAAYLWGKFRREKGIDNGVISEVTKATGSKRLHSREWRHDTQSGA